eukprot:6188583-Pleurochrysis_carterae.AAC.1
MVSGIIPEWQETNNREKKGTIAMMKLWTEEMTYRARIQIKGWMDKINEHKAKVQHRLDNRGNMHKAFARWQKVTGYEDKVSKIRGENEEEEEEQTKTYGIKHWGRVRTILRMQTQIKKLMQMGIG